MKLFSHQWKKTGVCVLVLGLGLSVAFIHFTTKSVPGVEMSWVVSGNQGLSQLGQEKIQQTIQSNDPEQITVLLDEHSGLLAFLLSELVHHPLNQAWSDSSVSRFTAASFVLRQLLEINQAGLEHQQYTKFLINKETAINYLSAYTQEITMQDQEVVARLDGSLQIAAANANQLFITLSDEQSSEQTLESLADWYKRERDSKLNGQIFSTSLLHSAWKLSARAQGVSESLTEVDLTINLTKETDLVRLLNSENLFVVRNSAALIKHFVPNNATPALRFQLARSNDNVLRFLLLDALKQYGQERDQIQSQLNKMLQVTSDRDLQEKIIETLGHLRGRPTQLLSNSR